MTWRSLGRQGAPLSVILSMSGIRAWKKNNPDRIEMMKYCKFCGKHTLHRETK